MRNYFWLTASMFSSVVLANTPNWELGGFIEAYNADGDRFETLNDSMGWGDGRALGLEIIRNINSDYAVRFNLADMNFDPDPELASEDDGYKYGADLVRHFDGFYGTLGLGLFDVENQGEEVATRLGVGKSWRLAERWKLGLEAAWYHVFDEELNEAGLRLGVSYVFGNQASSPKPVIAKKATPPPAPQKLHQDRDSDGDGVPDSKDTCPQTLKTDAVDAKGCTLYKDKVVTSRLEILFDNNKSEIRPEYVSEVARVADVLKEHQKTSIEIAGHTSAQGAAAYNLQLSQRRAEAVANMLKSDFGIAQDRIQAKGYGENRLLSDQNTSEAHRLNRRIEAVIRFTEKVKVKR